MIKVDYIVCCDVHTFANKLESYYNKYNVIDLKITEDTEIQSAFIIYKVN